jgi:hypothetical protein
MGRAIELESREGESFEVAARRLATKLEALSSDWAFRVSRRARLVLTTKRGPVSAVGVYYLEVPAEKRNCLVVYKRALAAVDCPPVILTVTEFAWFYENKEFSYENAAREILNAIIDYETNGERPMEFVDIEVEPLSALQL